MRPSSFRLRGKQHPPDRLFRSACGGGCASRHILGRVGTVIINRITNTIINSQCHPLARSRLAGMRQATRFLLLLLLVVLFRTSMPLPLQAQAGNRPKDSQVVVVDGSAAAHPFPHFWERMFGSGRAILALRDDYRHDLRAVKSITGFEYVRFHAIFHDEVGLYNEDKTGATFWNFSYVDQIYDGLLADGVRPFVELSFMPNQLASGPPVDFFWYKLNPSPPKDNAQWAAMIDAFVRHLLARYGAAEVEQWYFEVWNEPNIDFWTGKPAESTYYELYDLTAKTIKQADAKLRVGGPASAQAAWVDRFIAHCLAAS